MSALHVPLEIPSRLPDEMPLDEVFEGRFTRIFAREELESIGDLRAATGLTPTEIHSLNAWLRRCWWLNGA